MSLIPLDSIQADIKARLQSAAYLASIPTLIEHDPLATAEQLQDFDKTFEDAIATQGFVIGIKEPHLLRHSIVSGASLAMRAVCAVVIFENPVINRSPTGLQKQPGAALDAIIHALLPAYDFEEEPVTPTALLEELYTRAVVCSCLVERELP